ncbi:MAG: cyclase family protein [Anaerovoracaceae bacterium]|jgi:kynurenine formamidase
MFKNVVDMTQTLDNDMYIWPGDKISPDAFQKIQCVAEGDDYEASVIHCSTHTGTHMDCNSHTNWNDGNVYFCETKDPAFFIGRAKVVDCRGKIIEGDQVEIGMDVMDGVDLEGVDFLFFYMDWAKKWGTKEFWLRYPIFTKELAQYLADLPDVRGVGLETPGCDPTETGDLSIHKTYLSKDKTIFECLTNMDKVMDRDFTFIGLPLKIKGSEGSPIRAVAVLD